MAKNCPKCCQIAKIWYPLCIFGVAEAWQFRFGIQKVLVSEWCNAPKTDIVPEIGRGWESFYTVAQSMYYTVLCGALIYFVSLLLCHTILYHFCVIAVSKFCEAIVEYMANISSAPDPNIQIEFFYGEVCSAWEIFFNVWLSSKEAKVVSHFSHCAVPLSALTLLIADRKGIPHVKHLHQLYQRFPKEKPWDNRCRTFGTIEGV